MSLTISYTEGDGLNDDTLNIGIELPDANGGNLKIEGRVVAVGQNAQNVVQTLLAVPIAPASGSIFFNVQVDVTTGIATLQQSTISAPAPISGSNRIVYSQVLIATTIDPALDAGVTPDPPVGQP